MLSGEYDAVAQIFKHEFGCRCSDCNSKRFAVLDGWIRDIRGWLETQPGATEGDGSPLDGVLRVVHRKDVRIKELNAKLSDAEAEITDLKDCRDLLIRLGRISGCEHVDSPDERIAQVRHIERAFDQLIHERNEAREQLAAVGSGDDFSHRLKTLTILTKIAIEAGRLDNPVQRLTRILDIIGTFEG